MMRRLRLRQPGHSIGRILWWHVLHFICFVWFHSFHRYRAWGVRHVPAEGPLLFVSNHQSFYDPALVGLAAHKRQFYAMARSSLFHNPVFGWLIRSLNAVPVQQGESDTSAMRRCLEVLNQGHALLVFPEGTRSTTGQTGPFATGIILLVKRAKPTVVPVAIEGAQRVWPRRRALPRPGGRIGVIYGEPIPAETLLAKPAAEALEELRQTVEGLRQDAARRLG